MDAARSWNERVLREFADPASGGFFYSGSRHQTLLTRSRNFLDSATPSGNSMQVGNLMRLSLLTGDGKLWDAAASALRSLGRVVRQYPSAMGEMLCQLDLFHGPTFEVAISGREPQSEALVRETFAAFRPNKVVAGWPAQGEPVDLALLRDRPLVNGKPAAYVCRGHACEAPVTRADDLKKGLDAAMRP
jgi:uncharacterized protein YyaL (SSP411 family)